MLSYISSQKKIKIPNKGKPNYIYRLKNKKAIIKSDVRDYPITITNELAFPPEPQLQVYVPGVNPAPAIVVLA